MQVEPEPCQEVPAGRADTKGTSPHLILSRGKQMSWDKAKKEAEAAGTAAFKKMKWRIWSVTLIVCGTIVAIGIVVLMISS